MNTNDVCYKDAQTDETLFEFCFQPDQQMIIPRLGEAITLPNIDGAFKATYVHYEYVSNLDNEFQGIIVTILVERFC
jgi:hypothetical protein